ncbi:MAG TPA: RodZ domain-containing protein [Vicinamibacterales bacterium]|nr:RodZ domain-containing protein [Vicinamibacterales bacterium]
MNDFGGKLRLERERRGISLRQISAATKISIGALEALERNDISKLPGGIFSRSFVRSYAVEVGLNPDETVHEFLDRFQGTPVTAIPTPATASAAESAFEEQQRFASAVLKVALITVPLIVLILYFTMRVRLPTSETSSPPSPPPAAANTPSGHATTPSSATPAPAPVATSGATRPQGVDSALTLELTTTGDCWVKITADGKVTVARLMHAGDKEKQEVREKAVIVVGEAGAFAFSINGRPAKPLGPAGAVRTAIITKDTLASYLQ